MVKILTLVLLLPFILAATPAAGRTPGRFALPAEDLPWRGREVVTDGQGQVWGIVGTGRGLSLDEDAAKAGVGVYNAATGQWTLCAYTGAPDARPQRLAVLADGRAVCLWQREDGLSIVTVLQTGSDMCRSIIHARFTAPHLLPLPKGGLVVMERGPGLARIETMGGEAVLAQLPAAAMATARVALPPAEAGPPAPVVFASTRGVVGSDGSVYLWSRSATHWQGEAHLKTFVRWTAANTLEPVLSLPFVENAVFTDVVAQGEDHLLAAQLGAGLQQVDVSTSKVVPVRGPPAFDCIECLRVVKGQVHVVTVPPRPEIGRRPGALWIIPGADAPPELLLQGLDTQPWNAAVDRPFLSCEAGLLVGAAGAPPWWLPAGAAPSAFAVDGGQGFPLGSIVSLARVGNTKFIGASSGHALAAAPLPGDQPRNSTDRKEEIATQGRLQPDARQHLWGLRTIEDDVAEWDGHAWLPHPLPAGVETTRATTFLADSHQHGWLLSGLNNKTAVLDFTNGEWSVFDTLEQAVVKRLVLGDALVSSRVPFAVPISHRDGTRAFYSVDGVLHVWRQGRWTQTPTKELNPTLHQLVLGLWFSPQGMLRAHVGGKNFEFPGTGPWREVSGVEVNKELTNRPEVQGLEPLPAGCTLANVSFCRRDSFGVTWVVTREGDLWKWLGGRGVKITAADGTALLPAGSRPEELLLDAGHNVFIRAASPRVPHVDYSYTFIHALPPPAFQPASLDDADSAAPFIRLPAASHVSHAWRKEPGDWQDLGHSPDLKLPGLPLGNHRIEVQAFDDEFTPLGDLQVLTLTLHSATAGDIASLVSKLESPELNDREAAARSLQAQGPAVLRPLEKLLTAPATSSTQQWWLRAVIQRIKEKLPAGWIQGGEGTEG